MILKEIYNKLKGFLSEKESRVSTIVINGSKIEVPDGANVVIKNGSITVGGDVISNDIGLNAKVQWEGPIGNVQCDRSMGITGDVNGNIDAGGSVSCNNVSGNVDAGGSVNCGNVGKDVDAGGSVNCAKIGGNADAGGSIRCG